MGVELRRADCLEDSGPGGQIMRNGYRMVAPGGSRVRHILTDLGDAKPPGGSAKEKTSRVWGGSGVGAELRFELRSEPQSERS